MSSCNKGEQIVNLKKIGIKLILFTMVASILSNRLGLNGNVLTALITFGIGAGIVLVLIGNFSNFE